MYESENVKYQKEMRPPVHIKDRISNMGAMVLAVLVEKKSFFSAVSKSLMLKIVDSAGMSYAGPNIRVVV